jgi:hypothetical protein
MRDYDQELALASPSVRHHCSIRISFDCVRNRCSLWAAFVVVVYVLILAPTFACAKGGYAQKPPTPFSQQELNLIEKCRIMGQSQEMNQMLFFRRCYSVRPYLDR